MTIGLKPYPLFLVPTIDTFTLASGSSRSGLVIETGLQFEGATADAYETLLTLEEPTQDNTITIPDADMTAITDTSFATKSGHIAFTMALG